MAPPVFFTAARVVECPPPPGVEGALERWVHDTFGEALFETQQGRYLRFVRVGQSDGGDAVVVVAKSKEPATEDEIAVPMAALRDMSVAPCITKVFLALFHTTIQGTHGEITAKKTKAEGESIAKIVVERTPALGTGTVRATQSTLTVQSFLSQVAHKLTAVHLEPPRAGAEPVAGGTPEGQRDVVSWAAFPKLADLARVAEVFQSAALTLPWEDAEEFLTAAMHRPVSGKPAVISAAARLNTKLTAGTEVRTAIAAALDVARETSVELTMRDKGEIVAAQGVPSTTASPAVRAPAEAARRPDAQPDQRPLTLAVSADGSERASSSSSSASTSSDSYDGDTASDDSERRPRAKAGKRRRGKESKKTKKRKRPKKHKRSHSKKAKAKSSKKLAFSPDADLARLTPAGMKASQVAKVLFSHPALSQAVQYDNQAPDSDSEGEGVAQRRTAFAVRRLTELCGKEWLPEAQVASKDELRHIREHAVHLVARRGSGLHEARPGPSSRGGAAAGPSHFPPPIDVDAEECTVTLSTGAPTLSQEQKVWATLPDVVERLHDGVARLAYTAGHDVGAGIRSAPENLRADLARAVGSNGHVDAPGERKSARVTMPSVVVRMNSTLVDEVHDALRKLQEDDESGYQYMGIKASGKLAEAAVCGHYALSEYIKEVHKTMGAQAAPKAGSLDELNCAWRYVREALVITASALYDMKATDVGVKRVDTRLRATSGSFTIDPAELQAWLRRVLETWENTVTRFRRGLLLSMPSFEECVRGHDEYFRFASYTASLARRTSAISSRGPDGRRSQRSKHADADKDDDQDGGGGSLQGRESKSTRGGRPLTSSSPRECCRSVCWGTGETGCADTRYADATSSRGVGW